MLPEALRFQVGLIDQISKPLGNIQRQLNDVTNTYRKGTHTMMAGAAGMVGAGFALQNALMPAIEMDRVLGEVKSLGVADEQLQQLSDTALKFAVDYGKSATEFVAASYDIKSAMGDLTGEELSSLSMTAAVTAAATKADTGTITDYFGTMYGIFHTQAKAIGKDAWAEQLGSYTALAVERFKTDGNKLSQTFKTLGNTATDAGVKIGEQFAVLGLLGNQMDGSVAATKYQAFISKAAGAGEKLGLNFLDSNKQLLDTASIIDVIKGRYGDSLDALEKMELEKAFGGKEGLSFISTLYGQTGELRKQIDDFGQVKGLDQAKQMAGAMTDQWERLEQGVFAVRAAFGQALLPVILPVVEMFANGAKEIVLWTKLFPNITKYIGLAAVALLGLVAVGGMITMLTGAVTVAWATLGLGATAIKGATLAMWSFSKSTMAAMWSVVKLTAALLVNPITWVVIGIVAAIAAVAALVYYWDDLKAAFLTFTTMAKQGWNDFLFAMQNTAAFQAVTGLAESMRNAFMSVFNWIIGKYNQVMDMVKSVTSWIPGFGGDDESTQVKSKSVQSATPRAQIQPGGAAKNIASYQTSSTNYGGVAIYPTYMNSPQDMASEIEMAAG
ncbi:TPA: phage tail tape measure protein [Vibrio parahaemolyticus]